MKITFIGAAHEVTGSCTLLVPTVEIGTGNKLSSRVIIYIFHTFDKPPAIRYNEATK